MTILQRGKYFILGVIASFLISNYFIPAFASLYEKTITVSTGVSIYVDDLKLDPKDAYGNPVETFIYDGTTYLPVRAIANAFDKAISWDSITQSVYIGKHNSDIGDIIAKTITLIGIEVVKPPDMTSYYVGEPSLNTFGMVVMATYSDGTTRDVTPACGFGFSDYYGISVNRDDFDSSTAGFQAVTVSYTENGITKTTQFTIEIIARELKSILIKIESSQLGEYTAFFIRVWAEYTNGTGNYLDPNFSEYTTTWNTSHSFTVSYTERGITKTAQHTLAPVYWDWVDNVLKPLG